MFTSIQLVLEVNKHTAGGRMEKQITGNVFVIKHHVVPYRITTKLQLTKLTVRLVSGICCTAADVFSH